MPVPEPVTAARMAGHEYGSLVRSSGWKIASAPPGPVGFRVKRTSSQRKMRALFQKVEKWLLGRQQWQKALWGCSRDGLLGPDSLSPRPAFISVSSSVEHQTLSGGDPSLWSTCGGELISLPFRAVKTSSPLPTTQPMAITHQFSACQPRPRSSSRAPWLHPAQLRDRPAFVLPFRLKLVPQT